MVLALHEVHTLFRPLLDETDMRRVIHKCSKNFIFDISYIYLIISQAFGDGEENGPKFVEPIPNVTVTSGRDASLPCVVNNLGTHHVKWVHIDRKMTITIHKHVITSIPRYSISMKNSNTWVLHVAGVRQEDQGYYMCQVNTNPVISQVGYLQVTEPPSFTGYGTPSTVIVRENQNVTLNCRAQGFPPPKIVWKREDERDITLSRENRGAVFSGESIYFEKISRNDMARYLCIASNGVPPSISRKIFINVEFSPIILVTYQLIVRPVGSNVTLECHTEANPTAETFWMHGKHLLSTNNDKHFLETSQNGFTTSTRLIILNVIANDYGDYKCLSKNLLGGTAGTIILDEYRAIKTTKSVISNTIPVTHPVNKLSSQRTLDEAWEKSQSSELNMTSIYKKNSFIKYTYDPKRVLNNLGSEFSTSSSQRLLILAIVAFVYSF